MPETNAPLPPAGSYIINPGSVWQTYTPSTGVTTYGNAPTWFTSGVASWVNAPAVVTPTTTPATWQVYQGAALGYAPMGANTAYTERPGIGITSNYAQNPSAYPEVKPVEIPSQISVKWAEKATSKLPEAKLESNINGYTLKNQEIANAIPTVKANANYINALFKEWFNRNATAQELAKFANSTVKDAANVILGQGKSPFATQLAPNGLPANGTITDAAGSTITTDEAGIPNAAESVTFNTQLNQVVADIRKTTEDIAAKESELAAYQANTSLGVQDVGEQLGRSAALVWGEQGALQQRRQTKELALIKQGQALETKLSRLQQDKQFIVQQAQQLSQNAQQNLSLMLNSMKGSSTTWSELPMAQRTALEQLAQQAWVPATLLWASIDAMANTAKYDREQAALKNNATSFGKVGVDESGNDIYWFIDTTTKTTTPAIIGSATSSFTDGTGSTWNIGGWATDPTKAAQMQSIANAIGKVDDSNIAQKVSQFTPGLTPDMIKSTSAKTGVSWEALMTMVSQESLGGTSNVAKNNNNYGGLTFNNQDWIKEYGGKIGTARPEGGNYVKFSSKQNGLDAMGALMANYGKVESKPKNQTAESYANLINDGKLKLENVPEKQRDSVANVLATIPSKNDTELDTLAKEKFNTALKLKDSSWLNSAVGPNKLTRIAAPWNVWAKTEFIAGVEQLVSGLTLQTLIDAKAKGATFGALSEGELRILASTASKIGSWARRDSSGKVTGYDTTESAMKRELDNIAATFNKAVKSNIIKQQSSNTMTSTPMTTMTTSGKTPSGITYTITND